jgi:hypothetical protein
MSSGPPVVISTTGLGADDQGRLTYNGKLVTKIDYPDGYRHPDVCALDAVSMRAHFNANAPVPRATRAVGRAIGGLFR